MPRRLAWRGLFCTLPTIDSLRHLQYPAGILFPLKLMDIDELEHFLFAHARASHTTHHQHSPSIMANTASHVRNCAVCEKDKPSGSFPDVSSDMRHQHGANTCRECFNKYLIQQVKEGQARAKCVECQVTLRYAHVKDIVAKTTLMNYEKVLLKLYVEEDEDFYYCVSNLRLARLKLEKCCAS